MYGLVESDLVIVVVAISTGVVKDNGPKIFREFGGSLELLTAGLETLRKVWSE